jgi:hypothetical protein
VKPLSDLLPQGTNKLVIVFVHGIGDTCPGYALDESRGWLRNSTLRAIGLERLQLNSENYKVNLPDLDPGAPPAANAVLEVRSANSRLSLPGRSGKIEVVLREITWSGLTRWLKDWRLGYDLTEEPNRRQNPETRCLGKNNVAPYAPPSRELANRWIKEVMVDRSMADAMLYVGKYGSVLRRALAVGLCVSAGGVHKPGQSLCEWPAVQPDTAFLLVTHSLGSRLLYDTLCAMSPSGVCPNDLQRDLWATRDDFQTDGPKAEEFALQLFGHTSEILMMANQLSFLDLARETGSYPYALLTNSGEMLTTDNGVVINVEPPAARSGCTADGAWTADSTAVTADCGPAADIISLSKRRASINKIPLELVAFSDTNDLLTWSTPPLYQSRFQQDSWQAHFTNVFVQNGVRWPLLEFPEKAHRGYFLNHDVAKLIRCGGGRTQIANCE